jgi:DNA-binding response OmpR family regulator
MKPDISPAENPARTPPERQPKSPQPLHLAEGDADIRRQNSELLIYSGYRVDTVENEAAAWNTLQVNNYDLVITARHFPKGSGVELLKKMHDASMRLPVSMTANMLPTWEFAVHPWMQATTVVRLPYTFEILLGKIKNLLRLAASARREISPPPTRGRLSIEYQRLPMPA